MLGTMYEDIDDQYQAEAMFEDLIEQAYQDALIDGEQQSLAYLRLRTNEQTAH